MESDIIIIGGGIAGVSLAGELAASAKVTLLEAEGHLGYHTSGRSAALYERNYGLPCVVALNYASGDAFRDGGYLTPRGLMVLARNGDDAAFAVDTKALSLNHISVGEAQKIVPILNPATVVRVGVSDDAWDIDTDRLLQDYARKARAGGATIQTGAQVTGITRDAAGWKIETGKGSFAAPVIVNAAGAWADTVAAMAGVAPLGLQPNRRSMARIPAPNDHDLRQWPMLIGTGETWYAKPDAGALIVSPAEEHPMPPHDAFADDMVLAEGLARYEEMVTTPVTRMLASWAGLRTFSPDRVPVVGFGAVPGFFWLAGQGGFGFQTAPALARLAADIISGRKPALDASLIAQLSPARFG